MMLLELLPQPEVVKMAMTKTQMKKRLEEAQKKINAVSNQFSQTFRNYFNINDRNKMIKLVQEIDKLIVKIK